MKKRNEIIDLLRGIGMLSVIIGHSLVELPLTHLRLGEFVYLYHIMLFFFVAGFLFDEKYGYFENAHIYIGKRFSRIFRCYSIYNFGFVILHNLLSSLTLISAEAYSLDECAIWSLSGIVLQTNESMLGAFWFLPVFLVSNVLFCLTMCVVHSIVGWYRNSRVYNTIIIILFILLFAIVGIYTNKRGMYLPYHIQTSFLAIPVMFAGWIVKKHYEKICSILGVIGCLISFVVLCCAVHYNPINFELSMNQLGNPLLFYPITFIGIFFCICLANILKRIAPLKKGVSFIGKYSYHFMALHFLAFKILDKCVSLIKLDTASQVSAFPHTYNFGLLYTIVAVAEISLVIYLMKKAFGYVGNRSQANDED